MLGRREVKVKADCAGYLLIVNELMKGLEGSAFASFYFHRDQRTGVKYSIGSLGNDQG